LHIVIIGAGLGGLACAIACRHENLTVTILEKASALSEVGAGIQLPPNATRVMDRFGLMPQLYAAGCTSKSCNRVLRWDSGEEIGRRPGETWAETKFGYRWHVMHRADYQFVLAAEAERLGAELRLGQDVASVESHDLKPLVRLADGETLEGDVVIGADGLRSLVRTAVLGHVQEPAESGDMAYRVTLPKSALEDDEGHDPFLRSIVHDRVNAIWWGPNMHVVMYGVRHDRVVNLVLVCPDDLPRGTDRQAVEARDMAARFAGWDPRLRRLLSKVGGSALKWKIWGMPALDRWTRGAVALLGDACHPSVPYAASGAAMAVEDGAVLGRLLGRFADACLPRDRLPALLRLYQDVRRERTGTVVRTADGNRELYHMVDGERQRRRDAML
ncbi:FAD/NAD(P)-binding domain-containing protein, partial [Teratosphaeria nubilosa]